MALLLQILALLSGEIQTRAAGNLILRVTTNHDFEKKKKDSRKQKILLCF